LSAGDCQDVKDKNCNYYKDPLDVKFLALDYSFGKFSESDADCSFSRRIFILNG